MSVTVGGMVFFALNCTGLQSHYRTNHRWAAQKQHSGKQFETQRFFASPVPRSCCCYFLLVLLLFSLFLCPPTPTPPPFPRSLLSRRVIGWHVSFPLLLLFFCLFCFLFCFVLFLCFLEGANHWLLLVTAFSVNSFIHILISLFDYKYSFILHYLWSRSYISCGHLHDFISPVFRLLCSF